MTSTLSKKSCSEKESCGSWGYHLILDCRSGKISSVKDAKNIERFVIQLVDEIDMKRFGDPTIVHFGTEHTTGHSLVQLIETSSITGHFVDENGDIYLDIFSCKPFKPETAIAVVKKFFEPKNVKMQYLIRQA